MFSLFFKFCSFCFYYVVVHIPEDAIVNIKNKFMYRSRQPDLL